MRIRSLSLSPERLCLGFIGMVSTRYRANKGIGQFRSRHSIECLVHTDEEGVMLRRRQHHAPRGKPTLKCNWIGGTDSKVKQVGARWDTIYYKAIVLTQAANQFL